MLKIPLLLALIVAAPVQARAAETACPAGMKTAKHLILVVASGVNSSAAVAKLYSRISVDGVWSMVSRPKAAVLGRSGLGWGWDQTALAAEHEPVKREGDGRTPAGVFEVGKAFGFAPNGPGADYLHLEPGKTYCVDDLRSPHYNEILPKSEAGQGISGEDMGTISLYRRGLLIDFPTSREKKGGSCIFIHVWRAPASHTSGCVALGEADVAELQDWAHNEPAVVAVLPQAALNRLQDCFPLTAAGYPNAP